MQLYEACLCRSLRAGRAGEVQTPRPNSADVKETAKAESSFSSGLLQISPKTTHTKLNAFKRELKAGRQHSNAGRERPIGPLLHYLRPFLETMRLALHVEHYFCNFYKHFGGFFSALETLMLFRLKGLSRQSSEMRPLVHYLVK